MPNVKVKTTRCSHQQNVFSVESGDRVKYVEPNGESGDHERLAMGKEVEVAQNKATDCPRKTPSLDGVLDQLQGISVKK